MTPLVRTREAQMYVCARRSERGRVATMRIFGQRIRGSLCLVGSEMWFYVVGKDGERKVR